MLKGETTMRYMLEGLNITGGSSYVNGFIKHLYKNINNCDKLKGKVTCEVAGPDDVYTALFNTKGLTETDKLVVRIFAMGWLAYGSYQHEP
jgi:hypothetical protein